MYCVFVFTIAYFLNLNSDYKNYLGDFVEMLCQVNAASTFYVLNPNVGGGGYFYAPFFSLNN